MSNFKSLLSFVLLATAVAGQQVGTLTAENHPKVTWSKCTGTGSSSVCTVQNGSVVVDSNWRWLHSTTSATNCYEGNSWNSALCPDAATCSNNCALDGADYSGTYGITTSGSSLTLKYVTNGPYSTNIGSRVYLMDTSDSKYELFKPNNKEFTFDVDVSNLPCGLNGALYFVEMAADGGLSKYPTNKAGAKYGTGYCDAQCPHDIKFINGQANLENWTKSATDSNSGTGRYGTCCPEMDIWEANSISNAYTPHPCSVQGQYRCDGATECGDGASRYTSVCDKDGCDFNPFRMGDQSFYGPGKTVDTTKKMTVVTQFITADGTDTGALKEIRRLYVQNGVIIQNTVSSVAGVTPSSSLTDGFCEQQKTAFGDNNAYKELGGMVGMGEAQQRGVVLVMSIWGDHAARMLWLDSSYPLDRDESDPGIKRGTCSRDSGDPAQLVKNVPNSSVTFSNIKFGTIGSTYGTGGTTIVPPTSTTTSSGSTATNNPNGAPLYGQCGGINWTGPTTCAQGTCKVGNPYYSQCLP